MAGLSLLLRRGGLAPHPVTNDYLKIEDEEVLRILIEKGVSADGIGVTKEDAMAVTSISTWFSNNTLVKDLSILNEFENVTELAPAAFSSCSAEVVGLDNIVRFGKQNTFNKSGIKRVYAPKLEYIGDYYTFAGSSNLEYVDSLGIITAIPRCLDNCKNLKKVVFPETLATMSAQVFYGSTVQVLIVEATTPPAFEGNNYFAGGTVNAIYVPAASLADYKAAYGWKNHASKIKGISEYNG